MGKNQGTLFNVVLLEPEIPQNTGNIGRTCVGTGADLHLIEPLGFEISDKHLKRAGLDYWPYLKWYRHKNLEAWKSQVQDSSRIFYFSTKATKNHFDVDFKKGDWLVFGRETKGLPAEIIEANKENLLKIPQIGPVRSLNLATAVAIVLYEGLRQLISKGEIEKN